MTKFCTSCKKTMHEDRFGTNRQGKPLSTCKKCLAEQKRERGILDRVTKPEFAVDLRLAAWLDNHARQPNRRGVLTTIRAWDCAGMDEGHLVLGDAIERVVDPLFGHPMYAVPQLSLREE